MDKEEVIHTHTHTHTYTHTETQEYYAPIKKLFVPMQLELEGIMLNKIS